MQRRRAEWGRQSQEENYERNGRGRMEGGSGGGRPKDLTGVSRGRSASLTGNGRQEAVAWCLWWVTPVTPVHHGTQMAGGGRHGASCGPLNQVLRYH